LPEPTGTTTAPSPSAAQTPAAPATATAPTATTDPWRLNATGLRDQIGETFTYQCSPNGSPGTIWGTDTYTDDSSICTSAVHAGLITLTGGGQVTIEVTPGQDSYEGTDRNGITSLDYGVWGGSFVFVTD
jgi:hypothetical protein